jgi:hypothetical protein
VGKLIAQSSPGKPEALTLLALFTLPGNQEATSHFDNLSSMMWPISTTLLGRPLAFQNPSRKPTMLVLAFFPVSTGLERPLSLPRRYIMAA